MSRYRGGQVFVDGYRTPWKSGVPVGDCKLVLNKPIDRDGKPTMYAVLLFHFIIRSFWTKKQLMEGELHFKPVPHDRWRSKPDKDGKWTKYDKPGYHYHFGSYFTILSDCGLIEYDHKAKVWVPGPRLEAWKREVLYPEMQAAGFNSSDKYIDAFQTKIEEIRANNK